MKKTISLALAILLIFSVMASSLAAEGGELGINISNDNGDYTYFDSNVINPREASYATLTVNKNGNYIELPALNYKNVDKSNYIYMEKFKENSCSIDIAVKKKSYARSSTTYRYYVLEGMFKSDILGCEIAFPQLTYTRSGLSSKKSTLLSLKEDGSIYAGSNLIASVKEGEWFSYKVYFDLEEKKAYIYLNGEKCAKTVALADTIADITKLAVVLESGKGNLFIKNMKVRGLVNPIVNETETPSSIFIDAKKVEAFLKDKIAFHLSKNVYCVASEKYVPERAVVAKNDEVFADFSVINHVFGTDLKEADGKLYSDKLVIESGGTVSYNGNTYWVDTADNGAIYVSLTDLAKDVFGKHTFIHAKSGVVLISDTEMNYNADNWKYQSERTTSWYTDLNDIDTVSNYLLFDSPDINTLINDIETNNKHPRIIITQEKIKEIDLNSNTDERLENLLELFYSKANKMLSEAPLKYKWDDSIRMRQTASVALDRILCYGLAWHLKKDNKYAAAAQTEISTILSFPDFNMHSELDSAEFNEALAIGYDWFYDYLSEETKKEIVEKLMNDTLKLHTSGYYGGIMSGGNENNTFKWASNIGAIANGASIICGLAIFENDPQKCADMIKNGLLGEQIALSLFAPQGGWPESLAYWNMTCESIGYVIKSLINTTGSDYGLSHAPGFQKTLDYASAMFGVAGSNPVGDMTPVDVHSYATYSILGEIFNNYNLSEIRIKDIERTGDVSPLDIISYNPPTQYAGNNLTLIKGVEYAAIRNTYDFEDENALYFSTHFGTTSGYHQHNDTGTFVFDLLGERWAEDLGKDSYNLENEDGYEAWELYRKRAEGHNVIVFGEHPDGFEQLQKQFVPIEKARANSSGGFVYADMSSVYEEATNMLLGYKVGDNMKSLTTRYEMNVFEEKTAYWFMHTKAQIEILNNNCARLTQNGKSILVKFVCDAENAEILSMSAQPLETSPKCTGQAKNENYRKLAIKFTCNGETNLTIKMMPEGIDDGFTVDMTPISQWDVNG